MFDVEVQCGIAVLLTIVYLYAIVFSGFYFQLLLAALCTVAHFPDVYDGVTVDYQTKHIVSTNVEQQRFVTCRLEGAIQTCREVLQLDTRSKYGITAVVQVDGLTQVDGSHGLALHLHIVPENGLHTRIA